MKSIKNLLNLSVGELLQEYYNLGDEVYIIPMADIENHIRLNSNGYDKWLMSLIYEEIRSVLEYRYKIYWNGIEYDIGRFNYHIIKGIDIEGIPDEERSFFDNLQESKNNDYRFMNFIMNNAHRSNKLENPRIKNSTGAYWTAFYGSSVLSLFFKKYGTTIDKFLEETENKTYPDGIFKRPNNTLKEQMALLEYTGIIDHLMDAYGKNDSKMSELLSNILNRDKQNLRSLLSFCQTKERQSNDEKNKKFINDLFAKIYPEKIK